MAPEQAGDLAVGQQDKAPKRKRRWGLIVLVVWLVIIGVVYVGAIIFSGLSPRDGFSSGRGIALIRLDGIIAASGLDQGVFSSSGASPEAIIEQLREAEADPGVQAILIRVNSPGGTAAAAQEIHREVKRVTKPVVVSIADVGASGAYYVASGADQIMASRASMVGSIGVLIEIPDLRGLYEKLGVDFVVIRQGKYKDIGNPARELTTEERQILSQQAELVYEQFIEDVAEGRGLRKAKVQELATGLAYPGSEALDLKLVDELGNYQDAIDLAAELGKIEGEPEIIEYMEPTFFNILGGFFSEAGDIMSWLQRLSAVQPLPLSSPRIR